MTRIVAYEKKKIRNTVQTAHTNETRDEHDLFHL